jgi:hypothetical protein
MDLVIEASVRLAPLLQSPQLGRAAGFVIANVNVAGKHESIALGDLLDRRGRCADRSTILHCVDRLLIQKVP